MSKTHLEHLSAAPIPTRHGDFDVHVFHWRGHKPHPSLSDEHIALVQGPVEGRHRVPVRVHSECLTSEVFGSLKCDCKEQFEAAQAEIHRRGGGILLYLRQEGRGIGLANKIKAYALQADGADTIEANELLHLPVDARTYDVAADMLRHLGVESIELMTNNPKKIEAMTSLGVQVEGRIPTIVPPTEHSEDYLQVKRDRMDHKLPNSTPEPSESVPHPAGSCACLSAD